MVRVLWKQSEKRWINGPVNLLFFHHNRSAHSVVSLVQLLGVKSKLVSRLTITIVECRTKQNTLRTCLEEFTSKHPFGFLGFFTFD